MESAKMCRLLLLALVASAANAASEVEVAIEKLAGKVAEEAATELTEKFHMCYMGMKSGLIDNSAIRASSYWSSHHFPYYARLDHKNSAGDAGCWASRKNHVGQWIQVDLGTVRKVAGVIIQGRPQPSHYRQWVTSYKVACGNNLHHLHFVKVHGHDKVFKGNSDPDTKVYNEFPTVHYCRWVRIYPLSWQRHISMRFELMHGQCFGWKFH